MSVVDGALFDAPSTPAGYVAEPSRHGEVLAAVRDGAMVARFGSHVRAGGVDECWW